MIQTALFFILGFLTATFIAVLVAPAIWKRAVDLTRRRIEASMPLKLNEIRAQKDMVRAEAAAEIRKLEMTIKSLKEREIEASLEAERRDQEIRELTRERAERIEKIEELVARASELEHALASRVHEIEALGERLATQERLIDEKAAEISKLAEMYDEASFAASTRQIELVAQEAKIEQVRQDLSTAKNDRNKAEQQAREASADLKAQKVETAEAQKKATSLQKQVDRLAKNLAELEEKLERRERELARLKEKRKSDGKSDRALQIELREEQDQRAALEERISVLTAENREIRSELGKLRREGLDVASVSQANDRLRSQISELAAEVVALTLRVEGPDSPISRILSEGGANEGQASGISLADRIRLLQQTPSAKRKAS